LDKALGELGARVPDAAQREARERGTGRR
jgi:hypothetical protein